VLGAGGESPDLDSVAETPAGPGLRRFQARGFGSQSPTVGTKEEIQRINAALARIEKGEPEPSTGAAPQP